MTTIADTPSPSVRRSRLLPHLGALALVAVGIALAWFAPDRFDELSQEDRLVEWLTAVAFLAAAALHARDAWRGWRARELRWGAILLVLFCLFVAGEEVSWGQRLVGYTAPDVFLEHNRQQETNLHNFAELFGRPKWGLLLVLLGYGVVLPLVERTRAGARALGRLWLDAPALALVPWFMLAIAALVWYPVDFTGEWVEALTGWLFLAAAPATGLELAGAAGATLLAAVGLSALSAHQWRADPARLACARAEVGAIVQSLGEGGVLEPLFEGRGHAIHKRLWTAAEEGFVVSPEDMEQLQGAECGPGARAGDEEERMRRRRFGIDPWGNAYWVRTESDGEGWLTVTVYSFGANGRRDDESDRRSDDVRGGIVLPLVPQGEGAEGAGAMEGAFPPPTPDSGESAGATRR